MTKLVNIFHILFVIAGLSFTFSCKNQKHMPSAQKNNSSVLLKTSFLMQNKIIPDSIRPHALKALDFFPELNDYKITFKFKNNIRKSTMQAQPKFSSIFKSRKNREYLILISEKVQIEEEDYSVFDMDDSVMIGWLGHELGHIMDYKDRSALGMIVLGIRYLLSPRYIQKVERQADTYAIQQGMYDYILATKNFILNHSAISPEYKERIKRLYLSPEEIMKLVNELDDEEIEEKIDEELEEKEEAQK